MASDAPESIEQSQATVPVASNAAAPEVPAAPGADPNGPIPVAPEDLRLPTRKDVSLRELLNKIDDYAPIIPDAVTHYYMTKAGLPPPPQTDPRLARLLALATQKFIADIAADAYQYSRIRASSNTNNPMGSLGAAAGFPVPGQHQGGGGGAGVGAAAGGTGSQPGVTKAGGSTATGVGGAPLGIQRPGYGGGGQGGSQNRTVLTMEDLGMAVGEYGVNIKRSEFYR